MEKLRTLLKLIENSDSDSEELKLFLASESGKKIHDSLNLFESYINLIQDNSSPCAHDLEEVCAYFELQLSKDQSSKIEKQILECNSCFETFQFLNHRSEEIKNLSPQWLKTKVLQTSASKIKKSFW